MHKSRLGVLVIDCQTDDLAGSADFWSAALGSPKRPAKANQDPKYLDLETATGQLAIILQQVDHPSRVHLDIESDDIDAEAARLEDLGAKRIAQIKTWWVMEAPSGHRFCIVNPQRDDFDEKATTWP